MLIEQQKRSSRVRFKHPVRVVTLDGQPRVIRTLTANVSHKGMFVRMPEPLPTGTRVALSLEAGGRALALAQAEVVWARQHESQLPGRFPGCGVRFTDFLHPRAQELVDYLVDNLDTGKPLVAAPPERPLPKWLPLAAVGALVLCAVAALLVLQLDDETDLPLPASGERVGVRGDPTLEPETTPEPKKITLEPVVVQPPPAEPAPEPVAVAEPVAEPAPEPEPVAAAPVAPPPAAVEPAPVVAAPVVAPKASPLSPTLSPAGGEGDKGTVSLPSGATKKLTWHASGASVTLDPGATVSRAFLLNDPPRAVFDLDGPTPSKSHTQDVSIPHATRVRLGKLPAGTRVVIDLDRAPKSSKRIDDRALELQF